MGCDSTHTYTHTYIQEADGEVEGKERKSLNSLVAPSMQLRDCSSDFVSVFLSLFFSQLES